MDENKKNPLRKDPEGRAITEADNKTKKLIVTVVCLAFAAFGILTNSFLYINSLKKAGIFLGFTLCLIFMLYPTKIKGKQLRTILRTRILQAHAKNR